MTNKLSTAGLFGLLTAAMIPGRSEAQQLTSPPTPTVAQAVSADQRQGQYVDADGVHIFYQVAGTGTPLLLIHGFPLSGQLFQGQLAGLSRQFRVITPDHAASARPPRPTTGAPSRPMPATCWVS